jgi:hypothetical protein
VLPGLPGFDLWAGSGDSLGDLDAGEVHLAGGFLLAVVGLGGGVAGFQPHLRARWRGRGASMTVRLRRSKYL